MTSTRTSAKQPTRSVPAATPEDHLAYLLARVHHRLQQAMDRALRTVDITPTQFYALAHIAQTPGLSGAELARALLTTPQATATLIGRLTAAGLVERDRPGPGVSGAVSLTPAGRRRLRAATTVAVDAEAAALSSISRADQRRVTTVLQSLLEGLERAPD
ncbi:MarR family winged helix-turn-helix transcriptional regulator [uncultured Jatrophihabitans sp.]|uniref:MarR family winged helix-turn-helix transcriptional regulator n=1 Tax=uncultured Jatrophihabitans sp. TaxID=1610747 RepID=UPI0035CC9E06